MNLDTLLPELLKAAAGVSVLMIGWIIVQQAWNRVFPEAVAPDGDALGSRGSCHGCEKEGSCSTRPPPRGAHH